MYVLRRLLGAIPSLIGVVIVTFLMTRALPGDPAAFFAGAAATPEAIEDVRKQLGLDRPLIEQFFSYGGALFKGDWGQSLSTGQPVLSEISTRLPASLELIIYSLLLALCISIPLGVLSAKWQNSPLDHSVRFFTTLGVSIPAFFTGLLLIYIFYFLLGIAPMPIGRIDPFLTEAPKITGFLLVDSVLSGNMESFTNALGHMILPVISLTLFILAPLTRMTRASMLGVLRSDFVRSARANGIAEKKVLFSYALKNAILPVVTTSGMVFSFLLGSIVLIEKVFAWPGIGSFALEALIASDYAPVQGFVLTMALLYIGVNLIIDIANTILDPRMREKA